MISKKVIGRLGNQLFQYAAIRSYIEKYHLQDEKIDLDLLIHYKAGFDNDIIDFKLKSKGGGVQYHPCKKTPMQVLGIGIINLLKIKNKVISKFIKENYDQLMFNSEKRIQPFINKFGLYYFSRGYYNFPKPTTKNLLFYGTFESYKFFDEYRDIILEEFQPKYGVLAKNIKMYHQIEQSESVCVTIRRGDFVSVEKHKKRFYICTPEYFEKAIALIKRKLKNPKFFIFSDDIEWCKKNLTLPKGSVFETGDDPVWEKLRLMYSCKHFIISNSTFSWWAQYLSRNENKIVVAPNIWKRNTYHNIIDDLYKESWDIIDIE